MAATEPLREALTQGISSGIFVDTKIILFSHRDSSPSRRVSRPKALYASSHVLKTIPKLKDSECTIAFDISSRPHDATLTVLSKAESRLEDPEEAIDEKESVDNYEYLSDSDLEEDGDELKVPAPKQTTQSKVPQSDASEAPGKSAGSSNSSKTPENNAGSSNSTETPEKNAIPSDSIGAPSRGPRSNLSGIPSSRSNSSASSRFSSSGTRSDSSVTSNKDLTDHENSEPGCLVKLRVIKIPDMAFVT
jgi:hypothetical protein